MANNIIRCIKSRRSIRKYDERAVSGELLQHLLDAAIWAPSGTNSQSWLFTAIQNKGTLAKLNEVVRGSLAAWKPDDAYPVKKVAQAKAMMAGFNFYYNAPTLIVASNSQSNQNGMPDCAAALQNIMLAAHSLGLGSCWINQLRWVNDHADVKGFLFSLGIPTEHVVYGAVAVGYAAHTPEAPARKSGTTIIIR